MQVPQVISILEIVAPTVLGMVFIVAAAAVVSTWIEKRGKRLAPQDAAAQARIEERLNHLTNAVESMAVEVERISEGQRFTTKLLADNTLGAVSVSERTGTSP
ncbi:MAG: hypothetical protein ABR582_06400 [Gemmatimonadaceae bacterium]